MLRQSSRRVRYARKENAHDFDDSEQQCRAYVHDVRFSLDGTCVVVCGCFNHGVLQ